MDPLHERAARIGLAATEKHGFALAGGYAIQAHGFLNRVSEDVDLYTENTGASDGNRTRAVGLGIEPIPAAIAADLGSAHTASDRDCPLITLPNCTLIARHMPSLTCTEPPGSSVRVTSLNANRRHPATHHRLP
ncbi:nucleotidyl transferase AbiEii/AbiGii toxin family protein [Actinomadura welshii]